MYSALATLRDALKEIDGVASCRVGIERNISPECYPMIRLVPPRILGGKMYNQRTAELQIFFGANVTESEGLEKVYEELFALEEQIIIVIKAQGGRYIDTVTDEDRLDTYKLMVIRAEIGGARPVVT